LFPVQAFSARALVLANLVRLAMLPRAGTANRRTEQHGSTGTRFVSCSSDIPCGSHHRLHDSANRSRSRRPAGVLQVWAESEAAAVTATRSTIKTVGCAKVSYQVSYQANKAKRRHKPASLIARRENAHRVASARRESRLVLFETRECLIVDLRPSDCDEDPNPPLELSGAKTRKTTVPRPSALVLQVARVVTQKPTFCVSSGFIEISTRFFL